MSTVGLVSYVGRFRSHVVDSHELALLLSLLRKSSKIVDYPLINAVASGYYWNLFLDAFLTFHHFLSNGIVRKKSEKIAYLRRYRHFMQIKVLRSVLEVFGYAESKN